MSITGDGIWAASPSTERGTPTPLSSDSKGERIAYASNKSIFVRNIDDPSIARQYTDHVAQTTVARFSPSGFYVASGDVSGMVRVWDCMGEGATKGEYPIIAGRINDIAWDGDSQRIIAVGNGKERFGRAITYDSGNSVGEISGHSAQINCVSIRQQRPLRAATGSDDTSLAFFHGAPFKYNVSVRGNHNKFVYGTAFSPDGATLVSVGSDRRIWLYDGKTGESKNQIGEGEHTGSIFGVSWSPDSKKIVTCSADQTVKVWDVEAGKCIQTWRMGEEGTVSIAHHQVGVTWPSGRKDGLIISLDLEGNLNYFQEGSDKPIRIVSGHQKAITAAAFTPKDKTLWTGSYEGRVCAWDLSTAKASYVDGDQPKNYVSALATSSSDGRIYAASWDDALRTVDASTRSFTGSSAKTNGQPKGVAVSTSGSKPVTIVATISGVTLYSDGQEVGSQAISFTPTSIAAKDDIVAIGGEDKIVRIYTLSGTSLTPATELRDPNAAVSTLSFTTGSTTRLAVGLGNGKIFVYTSSSASEWTLTTNRWSAHTARVTCISWSPDNERAISGALDTNIYAWSLADPGKRVKTLNAHKDGVASIFWIEENKVISCGADAAVKSWKVENVK